MGIGSDADMAMLKAFVKNNQIPVIKSNGAKGIARFFRWVTMSTIARATSVAPNNVSVVAPTSLMDEEEITI
jgi:imidazole glycerol phosphate synthase subunit HisF